MRTLRLAVILLRLTWIERKLRRQRLDCDRKQPRLRKLMSSGKEGPMPDEKLHLVTLRLIDRTGAMSIAVVAS
jgi:hypothetical protein